MRAIAQYAEYGIQIQPMRAQGLGDGSIQITQQPLYAKFDKEGMIYEAEIERAEKMFPMHGRTQHVDEATPTDIRPRLSVLDTEAQGWDESTRLRVESELLRKQAITGHFFIVEDTPIEAPFKTYDTSEKPAFQLVADLVEMGFDLREVLTYERIWGPKRDAVIEALEETIKDQAVEEIVA